MNLHTAGVSSGVSFQIRLIIAEGGAAVFSGVDGSFDAQGEEEVIRAVAHGDAGNHRFAGEFGVVGERTSAMENSPPTGEAP